MAVYNLPFPGSNAAQESSWEQQRLVLTAAREDRPHARSHLMALAKQASGELRSLLIRRSEVMKRLLELRRVVRHLVELYGEQILQSEPRESGEGFSETMRLGNGLEKSMTMASSIRSLPLEPDRKRFYPGPTLQRACRIALMEINGPASTGDIYDRIARRGSFQFGKTKRPLASIATALTGMVRKGEAITVHDRAWRCWQWNSQRDSNGGLADLIDAPPQEPEGAGRGA